MIDPDKRMAEVIVSRIVAKEALTVILDDYKLKTWQSLVRLLANYARELEDQYNAR